MRAIITALIIAICVFITSKVRAFETNKCVFNKQFQQVKKITKVRTFVYEYCIFNSGSACEGKYTVRKDWFNKNHKSIKCPITRELILEILQEGEPTMSAVEVEKVLERGSEGAKDTKDFLVRYFNCGHCHTNGIKQEVLDALQELKEFTGFQIFVSSGYRCKVHNKNVGGVANSSHTKGLAADIRMINLKGDWLTGTEMAVLAEESGLFEDGGLGIYNTFIHVDLRGSRARWTEV